MQDGASSSSAFRTLAKLSMNKIQPITCLACSPDLNSVEAVLSQMKEFIERKYPNLPDVRDQSYDELCAIVREEWVSITPKILEELVMIMPQRCQAVMVTNGRHRKH